MKKRILILHTNMELGGAETSLLGLLWSLDYDRVSVDLFLYAHTGELMCLLPESVRLLPEVPAYRALCDPIRTALAGGHPVVAGARIRAKLICAARNRRLHFRDYGHALKHRAHACAVRHLPRIAGEYDMAISFIDPHWIMNRRTSAPLRLGWFHTDSALVTPDNPAEEVMWSECTCAVNVSESCKAAFDAAHPAMANRSIVIENILAKRFVESRAEEPLPEDEMPQDGHINLLSVGRFCEAKNFDNVPDITRRLLADGLPVRWYLVGYGGDEPLIRRKIAEAGMEESVILLGKRDNPYPYLRACDLYVQPSRYEGKSVTVREAQMLARPVVITRFATSPSQLEDGADGVIVPMDNAGCAAGIAALLRDPARMAHLSDTCRGRDYSNAAETEKLYRLLFPEEDGK
jgi:glycosyltransferase involved in cell wall biosynthesis